MFMQSLTQDRWQLLLPLYPVETLVICFNDLVAYTCITVGDGQQLLLPHWCPILVLAHQNTYISMDWIFTRMMAVIYTTPLFIKTYFAFVNTAAAWTYMYYWGLMAAIATSFSYRVVDRVTQTLRWQLLLLLYITWRCIVLLWYMHIQSCRSLQMSGSTIVTTLLCHSFYLLNFGISTPVGDTVIIPCLGSLAGINTTLATLSLLLLCLGTNMH